MAINKIENAEYLDSDWQNEIKSKNILKKGWWGMDFANLDDSSTEPYVKAGSTLEYDGVLYEFDTDTYIEGGNLADPYLSDNSRPEDPSVDTYVKANIGNVFTADDIADIATGLLNEFMPFAEKTDNEVEIRYDGAGVPAPSSSTGLISIAQTQTGSDAVAEEGDFIFNTIDAADDGDIYNGLYIIIFGADGTSYGIGWSYDGTLEESDPQGGVDEWRVVTDFSQTDTSETIAIETKELIDTDSVLNNIFTVGRTNNILHFTWQDSGEATTPDVSNSIHWIYDPDDDGSGDPVVEYTQTTEGKDLVPDKYTLTFDDNTSNNNSDYQNQYIDIEKASGNIFRVWFFLYKYPIAYGLENIIVIRFYDTPTPTIEFKGTDEYDDMEVGAYYDYIKRGWYDKEGARLFAKLDNNREDERWQLEEILYNPNNDYGT